MRKFLKNEFAPIDSQFPWLRKSSGMLPISDLNLKVVILPLSLHRSHCKFFLSIFTQVWKKLLMNTRSRPRSRSRPWLVRLLLWDWYYRWEGLPLSPYSIRRFWGIKSWGRNTQNSALRIKMHRNLIWGCDFVKKLLQASLLKADIFCFRMCYFSGIFRGFRDAELGGGADPGAHISNFWWGHCPEFRNWWGTMPHSKV